MTGTTGATGEHLAAELLPVSPEASLLPAYVHRVRMRPSLLIQRHRPLAPATPYPPGSDLKTVVCLLRQPLYDDLLVPGGDDPVVWFIILDEVLDLVLFNLSKLILGWLPAQLDALWPHVLHVEGVDSAGAGGLRGHEDVG